MKRPGKIICVGLNYADHAEEAGLPIPRYPICFAKWPSSMIGHGQPIRIPKASQQVDFEAELAVVIGRRARDLTVEKALDFVMGYACFNDVTARDIQAADGQWTRSKSFDTFSPFGPEMVPASEIIDPQALHIRCLVNEQVMQESSTENMVFSVAEILAYLSQDMTLEPGDVIATGTPSGVGISHDPPRFLTSGDTVRIEIEGIGSLENPVIA